MKPASGLSAAQRVRLIRAGASQADKLEAAKALGAQDAIMRLERALVRQSVATEQGSDRLAWRQHYLQLEEEASAAIAAIMGDGLLGVGNGTSSAFAGEDEAAWAALHEALASYEEAALGSHMLRRGLFNRVAALRSHWRAAQREEAGAASQRSGVRRSSLPSIESKRGGRQGMGDSAGHRPPLPSNEESGSSSLHAAGAEVRAFSDALASELAALDEEAQALEAELAAVLASCSQPVTHDKGIESIVKAVVTSAGWDGDEQGGDAATPAKEVAAALLHDLHAVPGWEACPDKRLLIALEAEADGLGAAFVREVAALDDGWRRGDGGAALAAPPPCFREWLATVAGSDDARAPPGWVGGWPAAAHDVYLAVYRGGNGKSGSAWAGGGRGRGGKPLQRRHRTFRHDDAVQGNAYEKSEGGGDGDEEEEDGVSGWAAAPSFDAPGRVVALVDQLLTRRVGGEGGTLRLSRADVARHHEWYCARKAYTSRRAGRVTRFQREAQALVVKAASAITRATEAAAAAAQARSAREAHEAVRAEAAQRAAEARRRAAVEAAVAAQVNAALQEAEAQVTEAKRVVAAARAAAQKRALEVYRREQAEVAARMEALAAALAASTAAERAAAAAAAATRVEARAAALAEKAEHRAALEREMQALKERQREALAALVRSVPYAERIAEIAATHDAERLASHTLSSALSAEVSRAYAEFLKQVQGGGGSGVGGGDGDGGAAGDREEGGTCDGDAASVAASTATGRGRLPPRPPVAGMSHGRIDWEEAANAVVKGTLTLGSEGEGGGGSGGGAGGPRAHSRSRSSLEAVRAQALLHLAADRVASQGQYGLAGYSDRQVVKDARYRAVNALRAAGLGGTSYVGSTLAALPAAGRGAVNAVRGAASSFSFGDA